MSSFKPTIQERKQRIFEMDGGCASCGGPTMSAGDGGFTSDAEDSGPVAGYDPLMKKLDKVRKKRRMRNGR